MAYKFNPFTGNLDKVNDATSSAVWGSITGTLSDQADLTADLNSRDTANRDRANHTGTQTASTISDFDAEVANNSAVALNTAKVTNATHTGDATGDTALTIAPDAVTNTKLANMAVNTIKGRITSGTGDPEDLSATNVRTIINVEDGADVTDLTNVSSSVNGASTETSVADGDFFAFLDITASNVFKKITWTNIKAALNSIYVRLSPSASADNTIQPSASTVIPLTLKGAASQSANLLNIENSSATVLASISNLGALAITATSTMRPITITGSTTSPELLSITGTTTSNIGNAVVISPIIARRNRIGVFMLPEFQPSSSGSYNYGTVVAAAFTNSIRNITEAIGAVYYFQSASSYTGLVGELTTLMVDEAPSYWGGTQAPTTVFGLQVRNQGITGTTTSYGINIADQSGATTSYSIYTGSGNVIFNSANSATTGVGIGLTAPTAKLHLAAGSATASTAPLKLTSGTNLTTPEDGAFEFDGTNLYFTVGGVRKTVTLT